jgi:hypothetical protein
VLANFDLNTEYIMSLTILDVKRCRIEGTIITDDEDKLYLITLYFILTRCMKKIKQ